MKDVGRALAAGLRAPISQWRMTLLLWLARLVPIFLFFTVPFFRTADEQLKHSPDARALLDAPADASGFAFSWTRDFFRHGGGAPESVFWLIVFSWILVTVLSGGIVARLVRGSSGLFLAECGRYAGRFFRLGLFVLLLAYAVDVGVNSLLAESHAEVAKVKHVQGYGVSKTWVRGALYLALLYLVGAIHGYARIEIVARERRSVVVSWFRAVGTLLTRLPKLFLIELGMLGAAAVAALVALVVAKSFHPISTSATTASLVVFVGFVALASYLRTGVELGTVAARVRLLAPPAPPEPPQIETVRAPEPPEPDEYELRDENPLTYPPSDTES